MTDNPLEITKLKNLKLAAKIISGQLRNGIHLGRKTGAGSEFEQYRHYEPGDDPKRIDWKLYSRSNKYQVKESPVESQLDLKLMLDLSGSMKYEEKGISRLDYAKNLLASLAYLGHQQGDIVSLYTLKDGKVNREVAPSIKSFQRILHHFDEEFSEELFAGNYLSLDGKGKYYLVEFSWMEFPAFARSYLQAMLDAGITPVIAHPERQRPFAEEPGLLKELIDMGCISQITATSLVGGYSEEIRRISHDMLQNNLIHVIASDAHNIVERPFNFSSALDVLTNDYGTDLKNNLVDNAGRIYQGQPIEFYSN